MSFPSHRNLPYLEQNNGPVLGGKDNVRQFSCLLQGADQRSHAEACYSEDNSLVIWGDSHAASLSIGFYRAGVEFTQLTQSGCPPILGLDKLTHRKNCNDINNDILDRLAEAQVGTLVLHAAWLHPHYPLDKDDLEKKLSLTLASIRNRLPKSKIVLIGAVPRWPFGPLNQKDIEADGELVYSDKAVILDETNSILRDVSAQQNIRFLDPRDALCPRYVSDRRCILGVKQKDRSVSTYTDWGHLSYHGSRMLYEHILRDFEGQLGKT